MLCIEFIGTTVRRFRAANTMKETRAAQLR